MKKTAVFGTIATLMLALNVGCKSGKTKLSLADNPTTQAGRGDPTLDDRTRPCAWVHVDGQKGTFREQDGQPLLQWIIETPVSPTPTFRVEVLDEVIQPPLGFKCVLQTREAQDGALVSYGLSADASGFVVGNDYSLTNPGSVFTVKNLTTGETVNEIGPLAPGDYLIAAALENKAHGKETAAVSYFTVAAAK